MKNLNKLEKIQSETNTIEFIKSYPILKRIFKSQLEKEVIELVLSFQHNNKQFHMNYENIALILNSKTQTIRNVINKLSKLKYITTYNTSNYNGKNGGSSSRLSVNIDLIIKNITSNEIPKVTPKEETIPTKQNIPEVEEEPLDDVKVSIEDRLISTTHKTTLNKGHKKYILECIKDGTISTMETLEQYIASCTQSEAEEKAKELTTETE